VLGGLVDVVVAVGASSLASKDFGTNDVAGDFGRGAFRRRGGGFGFGGGFRGFDVFVLDRLNEWAGQKSKGKRG
jgi:hypothetical protein